MRLGLSRDAAMAAVAYDVGLVSNIVRLASDGSPRPDFKWTLREIEHLVAYREMALMGLIGGPEG